MSSGPAAVSTPPPLSSGCDPDNPREPQSLSTFFGTLVKWRTGLFLAVAVLFLASFNGQWRVGRDSAIYRQIARNLVRTHHYVFRPKDQRFGYVREMHDVVYPGLPVMLAAIQRVAGDGPVAPLIVMYVLAAATLWLTYRLCRFYLPQWLAISAVLLLGTNRLFLEQSNEILSDLPFLFGLMLSLYGYERLRRAKNVNAMAWVALGLVAPGLVFAAAMRPTFWMLAVAWVLACLWGLIAGDRLPDGRKSRAPAAMALGTLVVLVLLAVALDPRASGFGYEHRVSGQLRDFGKLVDEVVHVRLTKTMEQHLPQAFFALTLKQKETGWRILAWAYSLMLIGSGVWLVRLNRLWGLLVLCTIGALLAIGDVPRYYMMILPLLYAGWLTFCYAVARRMNWFHALPALAMLWGVCIVLVPNFVRSLDLVREQHGFDRKLRHHSFLEVYEDGKKAPIVHVADLIHQHARPGQPVIGPEPLITTYLADRPVWGLNSFLPKRAGTWGQVLHDLKFELAIFPAGKPEALYEKDDATPQLIHAHMLLPGRELGRTAEGNRLCEARVRSSRHRSTRGIRRAQERAAAAAAAATQPTTRP